MTRLRLATRSCAAVYLAAKRDAFIRPAPEFYLYVRYVLSRSYRMGKIYTLIHASTYGYCTQLISDKYQRSIIVIVVIVVGTHASRAYVFSVCRLRGVARNPLLWD